MRHSSFPSRILIWSWRGARSGGATGRAGRGRAGRPPRQYHDGPHAERASYTDWLLPTNCQTTQQTSLLFVIVPWLNALSFIFFRISETITWHTSKCEIKRTIKNFFLLFYYLTPSGLFREVITACFASFLSSGLNNVRNTKIRNVTESVTTLFCLFCGKDSGKHVSHSLFF